VAKMHGIEASAEKSNFHSAGRWCALGAPARLNSSVLRGPFLRVDGVCVQVILVCWIWGR
jgi:hypothetical protein